MGIYNSKPEKRYKITKIIGKGAFGIIYQVFEKSTKKIFAMKEVNFKNIKEKKGALKEILILRYMKNYIGPKLKEVFIAKHQIIDEKPYIIGCSLIMEYFNCDLRNYLKINKLNFGDMKKIMVEIVKDVMFLHGNGFIHRDLKPDNILMKLGKVCICDFNVVTTFEWDLGDWRFLEESEGFGRDINEGVIFEDRGVDLIEEKNVLVGDLMIKEENFLNENVFNDNLMMKEENFLNENVLNDNLIMKNGSFLNENVLNDNLIMKNKSFLNENVSDINLKMKEEIFSNKNVLNDNLIKEESFSDEEINNINKKENFIIKNKNNNNKKRIYNKNQKNKKKINKSFILDFIEKLSIMDKTVFCGTKSYLGPENIIFEEYNEKTDIWALGCIFLELALNIIGEKNHVIFKSKKMSYFEKIVNSLKNDIKKNIKDIKIEKDEQIYKILEAVENNENFEKFNFINRNLYFKSILENNNFEFKKKGILKKILEIFEEEKYFCDLLKKMLCFNPKERIDIFEIQNHKFFENIIFNELIEIKKNSFLFKIIDSLKNTFVENIIVMLFIYEMNFYNKIKRDYYDIVFFYLKDYYGDDIEYS